MVSARRAGPGRRIAMLLAGTALLLLGFAEGGGAGPIALVVAGLLLLIAGELATG